MNVIPQKSYLQRIVLPIGVAALFITGFLLIGLYAANLRSNLPNPFAPYDPATFGIPETLAGYRILAITNPENTACMSANTQRVLVQAVDPMPDNPLVAQGNGDVIFELKKLNPDVQWQLSGMMPVAFDRAQFVSIHDNWNRSMKNGCIQHGPIITPTSDPFTPYDPATFGIPETLAGYRILAVTSSQNSACLPDNTQEVLIQAINPMPENPMIPIDGGDIVFELKKLNPDVHWGISYIMPVAINRAGFVSQQDSWNRMMKSGCINIGVPIADVAPDRSVSYDPATFGIAEIVA